MSRIIAVVPLALLLSQASASVVKRQNGNINTDNKCPNNWLNYVSDNQAKCCPGAVYNEDDNTSNNDSAYCCVGATFEVDQVEFSSCFPLCAETASDAGVSIIGTTKQPCSATVFLTDADYNSKVSSAASSISWSGEARTTGASQTMGGSKTTASSGAAVTGSSSGSAAPAAETSSLSTNSADAAMITSWPLAMLVAGGLLLN